MEHGKIQFVTVLACVVVSGLGVSIESSTTTTLLQSLNQYSQYLRFSDNITIQVQLNVQEIIEFVESTNVLRSTVYLLAKWQDDSLAWNLSGSTSAPSIYLPLNSTWVHTTLFSSMESHPCPLALVTYSGIVYYRCRVIFRSECSGDKGRIPVDSHTCRYPFSSSEDSVGLVTFNFVNVSQRKAVLNPEFSLQDIHIEETLDGRSGSTGAPRLAVTIRRRYNGKYVMLFTILLVLNFMVSGQFLIPCSSKEKATVSISIIASILIVWPALVPLLSSTGKLTDAGTYLLCTLLYATVAHACTILLLHVHHNGVKDNQRVLPPHMKRWVLNTLAYAVGLYLPNVYTRSEALKTRLSCVSLVEEDEDVGNVLAKSVSEHYESVKQKGDGDQRVENHDDKTEHKDPTEQLHTPMLSTLTIRESYKMLYNAEMGDTGKPTSAHSMSNASVTIKDGQIQAIVINSHKDEGRSVTVVPTTSRIGVAHDNKVTQKLTVIPHSELKQNEEYLIFNLLKHCEESETRQLEETYEKELLDEWKQAAMILNRALFYIFSTLTVIWALAAIFYYCS